jgi:uncharacterized membrane protein
MHGMTANVPAGPIRASIGGNMNSKFQFLSTTVIGGIVFLVPIIVCIVILGKAFEIMRKLAVPLARALPIDSVAGLVIADLIAVVVIVIVCFIAGLVAKTALAAQLVTWLESNLLSRISVYTFIKGMTDSVTGLEESDSLKPVLARYDDNWQVAFEVERIDGEYVAIYVPGAPNPWSGGVIIMSADRIQPLDIPMNVAIRNVRSLGQGSNGLLQNRL